MVMNGNPLPTNVVMITVSVPYVIEKNEVLLLFALKQDRCSITGLMLRKIWGKQVQATFISVAEKKLKLHSDFIGNTIFHKKTQTELTTVEQTALKGEERIMSDKIVSELKAVFEKEDAAEIVEETIFPKHKWQGLQQALFSILQDDAYSVNDYQIVAEIIWSAVLLGEKVDTETAIGRLYYRLGNENDPYGNNTIWSIAARLKDLDYANSEYNPLRDPAILERLASVGIHFLENDKSPEA